MNSTGSLLFSELMNVLIQKINLGNYESEFGNYELTNITDEIKSQLINLMNNDLWIYDYTPYSNEEHYTRTNFSAFVKSDIIKPIFKQLSKHNIIVVIHDHSSAIPYMYNNGKKCNFENCDCDLITDFKLCFDDYGNPFVTKIAHIWDYGSDMELLESIVSHELYQYIIDNYVQISVVNKSFTNDLILEKLNEIINENKDQNQNNLQNEIQIII
jgi:hypothetical protein